MRSAPLIVALAGGRGDAAVMAAARALGRRLAAPIMVSGAGAPGHDDRESHASAERSLARAARQHDARMLLIEAGHHTTLDQLLDRETTLRLLREVDRPVLVVAATFRKPPRRVVVATDFGPAALRAAREAVALLRRGGTLALAHVVTRREARRTRPSDGGASGLRHPDAFDRLVARVERPSGVAVETLVLDGDPAEAIVAHAARTGADLIATGMSGAEGCQRMYVGGVATSIVRRASCSVLVAPA